MYSSTILSILAYPSVILSHGYHDGALPMILVYDHIQSRAPRQMHRRRHWDPVKDHGLIHPDLEYYVESGTAQVNAVRGMVVAKGTCVVLLQGMSPYNSYSTLFITIA